MRSWWHGHWLPKWVAQLSRKSVCTLSFFPFLSESFSENRQVQRCFCFLKSGINCFKQVSNRDEGFCFSVRFYNLFPLKKRATTWSALTARSAGWGAGGRAVSAPRTAQRPACGTAAPSAGRTGAPTATTAPCSSTTADTPRTCDLSTSADVRVSTHQVFFPLFRSAVVNSPPK